jgi:hypothetical protein
MHESSLVDAVTTWCAATFSSAVRASGIRETEASTASIASVRTIYIRRRRQLPSDSPLTIQANGILDALDQLEGDTFEMIRFSTNDGLKGIVMASNSGIPVFAFPLPYGKEFD